MKAREIEKMETFTTVMTDTITRLVAAGGKEWIGGANHRIYFKPEHLLGMVIERYKSGSLRNVTIDGESISNSKAGKIINSNFYYDVKTGNMVTTLEEQWAKTARVKVQAILCNIP